MRTRLLIVRIQPKDWSIKMNKKERRLALATALQSAAPSTTVVEDLSVLPRCFARVGPSAGVLRGVGLRSLHF